MEQMKPEDTDNMTKKSVQVPDSNPDTKVSNPARNGDDNGDWTNFVMGSESQAQGQTTDQSLNSIASGSTKSVHWNPDLVSESTFNHEASSPNGSNAYGGRSPALTSSTSFKDTVQDVRNVLGRWGKSVGEATKKAEDFAGNTWQHLKTSPSFTEAAMGRIAQGAKILAEGGYERVFRQTFETVPEEQLQNSFACYLSTSAGPVMGLLYVSTTKLAYCSDGPLSYKDGDKTEWSYYKVVIPLHQLKAINPSTSQTKTSDKYIQVISVDNHEFWFMGFLNYSGAVESLKQAMEGRSLQSV